MKKYLSRKDRTRRLSNSVRYYIQQLQDVRKNNASIAAANIFIININYADFFTLKKEMDGLEKKLSRTNLIRTKRGQIIKNINRVLSQMIPHQARVFNVQDLDMAIIRLRNFVNDLDSLTFVDMYGKEVK